MKSVFVLCMVILFSFIQISCNEGTNQNAYKFYDKNHEAIFIKKLEENGIKYRVDELGRIWFASKHRDLARKLSIEASYKYPLGSVFIPDEYSKNLFVKKLKENNIDYRVTIDKPSNGFVVTVVDKKYFHKAYYIFLHEIKGISVDKITPPNNNVNQLKSQ